MGVVASKPPQTLAGLGVLARTMTLSWSEMWDDSKDEGEHRAFMKAVCVFVGVKPVPEEAQSHD